VRPGERVVEIGAGVGVLTALIAKRTPAELVVAIEANPQLQDYIKKLHRLNGVQPIVRQALVTPSSGGRTATLNLHEDFWASSPAWIKRRSQVGAVEVPAITLAEIAETWRPSLLIVDIEPLAAWTHAEKPPHALAGADFRPFERVLIELKAKQFAPDAVKRVFDHFSGQGFAYSTEVSSGSLVMFERIPA
jgi:FkbM family methyltransferase